MSNAPGVVGKFRTWSTGHIDRAGDVSVVELLLSPPLPPMYVAEQQGAARGLNLVTNASAHR